MSSAAQVSCTEEEAQWRQQRQELYVQLYESGKKGLNRDAVLATRQHFVLGATFIPKPYVLPSDDDAVTLICAEIPPPAAKVCHQIAQELLALLSKADGNNVVAYVNELDLMHITLFHTSHPDELSPNAKSRCSADIEQLTDMSKGFAAFYVKPVRVLLASSGAVIMLFECLSDDSDRNVSSSAAFINANREFSVDHLRKTAKATFEHTPKQSGTRTIVHSTLGRILDPNVSDEALQLVYAQCEALTKRFEQQPFTFRIKNLWYVEETHHFSPQGRKTTIAFQ